MNHYDLAYLLALPAVAPVLTYKRLRYGKYRESLPGMLGKRLPAQPLPPAPLHRAWLHSVSVGETIAAGALYRELRRRELGWEFIATTTTETGQAQARQTLEGIEHLTYAPFDFSWTVRAFHRAWRPTLYIFFETEIWPNNLLTCGRRELPVFFVNGSLSEKSARGYSRARALFRAPLSVVRRAFMQTEADAERLARVLGTDQRIEVTGNVKFDALPEKLSPAERREVRTKWGVADDSVSVVIAGSTHPGEEELIWNAWLAVQERRSGGLLVIVPRHPERFDVVAADLAKRGAIVHRTSTGPRAEAPPRTKEVVLVDEMRVLAKSYGGADIALVAGSWEPIGGHNLLEAAVQGIPVLRGPHMHAQRDIVRVLGPNQGAPEVPADTLAPMIARLLDDNNARREMGALARKAALSNLGATKRTVDRLLECIVV